MPDTPSLSQLMEPPDTPGRFTRRLRHFITKR
jgi:hypothetical protein